MITLNNRPHEYIDGMTVMTLMREENFIYPRIVVHVNGKMIEPEDYDKTPIRDGDDVLAVHLMAGG